MIRRPETGRQIEPAANQVMPHEHNAARTQGDNPHHLEWQICTEKAKGCCCLCLVLSQPAARSDSAGSCAGAA